MADKVRLKVVGISYSAMQTNAYAVILAQADGPYRIPVVIGGAEAQSIAIKMENITPPRPLTHDLFVSFAHTFGVTLRQVLICKFEDGVFWSELTFSDGEREVVMDSRTSDAIAIAIRTQAPIYTTPEILEQTGFKLGDESEEESQSDEEEEEYPPQPKVENYSIEELERTLNRLIEQELYEEAAKIKAIITEKKSRNDNKE